MPGASCAKALTTSAAVGNRVIAVKMGLVAGVTGRPSTTGATTIGINGLIAITGECSTVGTGGGFTTGITTGGGCGGAIRTGLTTSTRGICVVVMRTRPLVVGAAVKR